MLQHLRTGGNLQILLGKSAELNELATLFAGWFEGSTKKGDHSFDSGFVCLVPAAADFGGVLGWRQAQVSWPT